ncbi:FGGY-family carbohydrate kinase [Microbacterium kribbense]|uniref:FGGY-family carbohydrate kinase n=1 Tax=Microbacterium kribbense TaxID=433645 RepID=A0ABP7GI76_9MICO
MITPDEGTALIVAGNAVLGVELGSTRIKACLIGENPADVLAVGEHAWESAFVDGRWTYPLDEVWSGVQSAYRNLADCVRESFGVEIRRLRALGISAMMHGYLAFDASGEPLVPFRTWRNTSTGPASAALTALFGQNIPLRWSVAHLQQAVLDHEPHVPQIDFLTTLAGYVHWRLTGRRVLGVGDASGMFPIDAATGSYDRELVARYDRFVAADVPGLRLRTLLPDVLPAGMPAGELTVGGAALLDPAGRLLPGVPLCPPEGDAGTGMVATGAIAPRTGNVSAGTSIFAMVVLERPLQRVHREIDVVTTPAGSPVAMVHCNNGASELAAWARVFARFAAAAGALLSSDEVFDVLFHEALTGDADAGGLLAYNYLAGETITGIDAGRPLFIRTPDSTFTLANMMRAQLYGVFGTLAMGMRALAYEGVRLDRMYAHGGMFRTAGVAQRFLAAALGAPVAVGESASEGGAWGIAVLAAYLSESADMDLARYLAERVFADAQIDVVAPLPDDVAGFGVYLHRYRAGLAVEHAAVAHLTSDL